MKAPHNHTETSIAAARSVEPTLAAAEREVYDLFLAHPKGLTTEEAEQRLVPRHGSKKHQSVSARVNGLWNRGLLIRTGEKRTNTSGRKAFVYYAAKEIDMAKRKKKAAEAATEEAPSREWHQKVMAVFMEQVGAGESTTGFTFDEIRAHMGLTGPDVEGYYDIAAAMVDLRNEGFLAHKFMHDLLKEDFFVGNPADIPNIQKRENEAKVRQIVFFVSPAAMAIPDEDLSAWVDKGEVPESKLPEGKTVFTRASMRAWMETLGEMIDLYSTDANYNAESAKMIAALMPEP